MDWSFPIGVDLTRDPIVTIEDGMEVRTWPGCSVKIPVEALGDRGPAEARPNAAEEPGGVVQELLARLWPVLKDVKTCRELGKAILDAGVEPKLKHALGRAARDRMGAKWSDRTVGEMLKPACHTEAGAEKQREAKRAWRADPANRERVRAWYADPVNAEKHRERSRTYYAVPENAERNRERSLRRQADNPEYLNHYCKSRRKTDEVFTLAGRVRGRIAHALRAARAGKAGKSLDLLGCTPAEFKAHLESLWTEGMSWESYGNGPGLWVVDHVAPVASFDLTTEEGQRQAFHFTNCQPMWFEENSSKGSLHEGKRWRHSHHA